LSERRQLVTAFLTNIVCLQKLFEYDIVIETLRVGCEITAFT